VAALPEEIHAKGAKPAANWVMGEVLRELKERKIGPEAALAPVRLAALVALIEQGKISASAAKEVFVAIWDGDEEPAAAIERLGLAQVSDAGQIEAWVREVIAEFPAQVAQLQGGKLQVLSFLVGQVMKRSAGRAQPPAVQRLMRSKLGLPEG
jgi:aspartyl-tRNA(Asn)/glutamyl-tRNA(Gln) amidotransferase subunit B